MPNPASGLPLHSYEVKGGPDDSTVRDRYVRALPIGLHFECTTSAKSPRSPRCSMKQALASLQQIRSAREVLESTVGPSDVDDASGLIQAVRSHGVVTWTPRHRPGVEPAPRAKRSQKLYKCQYFAKTAGSGTDMATGHHLLPCERSWHLLNMPRLHRSLDCPLIALLLCDTCAFVGRLGRAW